MNEQGIRMIGNYLQIVTQEATRNSDMVEPTWVIYGLGGLVMLFGFLVYTFIIMILLLFIETKKTTWIQYYCFISVIFHKNNEKSAFPPTSGQASLTSVDEIKNM